MSELQATRPRKLVRHVLEMEDGEMVPTRDVKDAAMANSAFRVVRMQIKDALYGLSPIFTKEALLAVCMEMMAEDDAPDGPQTKLYSDHFDEM